MPVLASGATVGRVERLDHTHRQHMQTNGRGEDAALSLWIVVFWP